MSESVHIDKCTIEGPLRVPAGAYASITNCYLKDARLVWCDPLALLAEEYAKEEK